MFLLLLLLLLLLPLKLLLLLWTELIICILYLLFRSGKLYTLYRIANLIQQCIVWIDMYARSFCNLKSSLLVGIMWIQQDKIVAALIFRKICPFKNVHLTIEIQTLPFRESVQSLAGQLNPNSDIRYIIIILTSDSS